MAFKSYIDGIDDDKYNLTDAGKVPISAHLELKRIKFLDGCVKAYTEAGEDISRNKFIKLCVDNMANNLNGLSNEEAIDKIKELHKEALF